MLRNKLVRSDGSIIDSSVIISCEFTEEVNSHTNLAVGDVTAAEISVELLSSAAVQQDEVLTYYAIEDGVETKIGVFNAEKPTVATRTTMQFSAYDNVVKTEKNFSGWLRENQSLFPMTLLALVQYACSYCGVTLATTDFPQAGLSVKAFYADNLTCRQIISWAAAIAGRFVRANANGAIEFAWYKDATNLIIQPSDEMPSGASVARGRTGIEVTDDGAGNISITSPDIEVIDDGQGNVTLNATNLALLTTDTGVSLGKWNVLSRIQDSFNYENYSTDFIECVQVKHSDDDVGVIYPNDISGNCFTISENMILGVSETSVVMQVAMNIYEQLKDITYVPCSATVRRTVGVRAGDIVSVITPDGNTFVTYVMKVSVTPNGTIITSTGDKSYGSNAAVSSETYSNLTGKILSLSKTVDGLNIRAENLEGAFSDFEQTVDGFKTTVSTTYVSKDDFDKYKTDTTTFIQTSTDFTMEFKSITDDIDDVKKDATDRETERKSYIRFVDGQIHLGKNDSQIMLILKNDRVSFVRNEKDYPELAYISNNILYINDGEFLTQLRIGKFGFTPGENGNLSFKKVVS